MRALSWGGGSKLKVRLLWYYQVLGRGMHPALLPKRHLTHLTAGEPGQCSSGCEREPQRESLCSAVVAISGIRAHS